MKGRYEKMHNPRGYYAPREQSDRDVYADAIHPFSSEAFEE